MEPTKEHESIAHPTKGTSARPTGSAKGAEPSDKRTKRESMSGFVPPRDLQYPRETLDDEALAQSSWSPNAHLQGFRLCP